MYFLYFVLCRTVYLVNGEVESIVTKWLWTVFLFSLEVPPSEMFPYWRSWEISWKADLHITEDIFQKEIGGNGGVGGWAPVFGGDLHRINRKALPSTLLYAFSHRPPCECIPNTERFYLQSTPQNPASRLHKAERTSSQAHCWTTKKPGIW